MGVRANDMWLCVWNYILAEVSGIKIYTHRFWIQNYRINDLDIISND